MRFENVASIDVANKSLSNIYHELNESSRGSILWNKLSFDERSFLCRMAKVGHQTRLIETANKKLSEFSAVEQSKILNKIQGLHNLTRSFANLSRYEFR